MHPLDRALVATCPNVTVPKYGTLAPIEPLSQRLLLANDGLWLEVARPWLHLVYPIAKVKDIVIPYGEVHQSFTFAFDNIPTKLMNRFIDEARAASPNEHAAWIIWNSGSGQLEYASLNITARSGGAISFERPSLSDGCELCVDLHSHGHAPAYFSATDDADDRGECKFSVVFGDLQDEDPTWESRLCVRGLYLLQQGPERWSARHASHTQ